VSGKRGGAPARGRLAGTSRHGDMGVDWGSWRRASPQGQTETRIQTMLQRGWDIGTRSPRSIPGGHARIPVRSAARGRRNGPALPQASRPAHASHVRALLATGPFLPSTNHSDASPQPESTQHASSRRSYPHLDRQHVPRLRHTNLTGPDRSTRTPIRQVAP
jgi:hypothetical protein